MARDLLGETRAFVLKWRSDRGLSATNALPNRNELPYQWMEPFLNKVKANKDKLKIGKA